MPRPLGLTGRGLRLSPQLRVVAAAAPPPSPTLLVTESGDLLVTESGDRIAAESA
jgi:hypothetical protein